MYNDNNFLNYWIALNVNIYIYIAYYNVMNIPNTLDSYLVNILLKLVPFFVNRTRMQFCLIGA
jgi:hypothetical protein